MSDASDVVHVSNELKELLSTAADLMKSDEELARMLQVFYNFLCLCFNFRFVRVI